MSEDNKTTYVDSSYFLDIVDGKSAERKEASDLISKILSFPSKNLVIPQIVIGEIIAILLRRKANDRNGLKKCISDLMERVSNINVNENVPPIDFCILYHVDFLKSQQITTRKKLKEKLDPTDILILSHAIADPNSDTFLTTDKKLLYLADIIRTYTEEMKTSGQRYNILNISDGFNN